MTREGRGRLPAGHEFMSSGSIGALLADRLRHLIRHERLISEHGRLLVALSGGADSVALTLLLHELAPTAGFTLDGVVHINHQLRTAAADDEQFCREFAERLSLPIQVAHIDVRRVAQRERISVEEAGHRVRYAQFNEVTDRLGTDRIATAHTRDDQGETYLIRLIRGAGPEGLAGIRPRSGCVIRPALDVSRAELRRYLAERGESFRDDETNGDLTITRNRVRHELIPFLEERFSPGIVGVLTRTAAIARGDAEWLEASVNKIAPAIVSYLEDGASVDAVRLAQQPAALARRVARRALEHVARRTVGFDQIERFRALAADPQRAIGEADFPGCRVEWRGARLAVTVPPPRGTAPEPRTFRYELGVPGRVLVPEAGVVISAEQASHATHDGLVARGAAVTVAAGDLTVPLIVRSWRPGDAVRPLGLGGSKKLQDLFVDRKVLRARRHAVPIVADKMRGIIWVVGYAVADDFRVTAGTKGMLTLKVDRMGGAG